MGVAIIIVLCIIGLGLPAWFVSALLLYKKDKKDTSKPNSNGLYVNFILSIVGIVAWGLAVLTAIGFFILGSLIVATM